MSSVEQSKVKRVWLDDATTWLTDHLGAATAIASEPRTPWSRVAQLLVGDRVVWLKEVAAELAWEPALTVKLSRTDHPSVPEVLAVDDRHLVTAHAGPRMPLTLTPDERPTWEDVVAQYAELQLRLARAADSLPAPDRRPSVLASADPNAAVLVSQLGEVLPMSLAHLEVDHTNVCLRRGTAVILDWGEAVLAHPFCGLTGTLRELVRRLRVSPGGPEVMRIRDAYLEPWTTFDSVASLRRVFAPAYALGVLCWALELERLAGSLPPTERWRWTKKVARARRRFAALVLEPERIGG
jgi:hypothetical protein